MCINNVTTENVDYERFLFLQFLQFSDIAVGHQGAYFVRRFLDLFIYIYIMMGPVYTKLNVDPSGDHIC